VRIASLFLEISLLLLVWVGRVDAGQQTPVITVTHLGIVSSTAASIDHAEPWLAIDPNNPSRAMAVSRVGSGDRSMAYLTTDAGQSWRATYQGNDADGFPGGDPVVVFDSDGNAFLATINPFRVWRSSNGGLTWEEPVTVPGRSYDREYLAIRATPGTVDTLYAMGKMPIEIFGHVAEDIIGVSRSVDGGRTFEYPRLFLPDPSRSIVQAPGGMLVTPDGKVLVSVNAHDVPVRDPALLDNHVWVMRSDDGGRSFGEPVPAATLQQHGNRGGMLPMIKGLASSGMAMDTARSSRFRGRVYLTWLGVHEERLQVMVASTSDTGRTWSKGVRVNDDTTRANHSNPFIAVNEDGALLVLWNDRRGDPTDRCFQARVSASVDGGASFLPSVALTNTGVCPIAIADTARFTAGQFRHRFANGGETQGLVAVPGGHFLAVWVDDVNGVMQLLASTIEVAGAPHADPVRP